MNPHTKKLFDLTGKVALVTGGAGWLGTAFSEALAEAGATVAIVDYNAELIDKTVAQFDKNGLKVIGIVSDAMQDKSLRESIDKVAADCGRLDILVNSAFLYCFAELDHVTFEDFKKGYRNSASYAIAAQQAAIHMRKVGGGSIINIGSVYGVAPSYPGVYEGICVPNPITYSADKAAVIQMTRYMAVFWAKDNIRINCISPGPFPNRDKDVFINNPKMPEFIERLNGKVPLNRIGEPWELKGVTAFLASEASSFVTGQNIIVDGGFTVW